MRPESTYSKEPYVHRCYGPTILNIDASSCGIPPSSTLPKHELRAFDNSQALSQVNMTRLTELWELRREGLYYLSGCSIKYQEFGSRRRNELLGATIGKSVWTTAGVASPFPTVLSTMERGSLPDLPQQHPFITSP